MTLGDIEKADSLSADELDLAELLSILWKDRILVILVIMFSSLGSLLYSLSLPNIYNAEAVLVPIEGSSLGGSIQNQLGLAANLTGASLSQQADSVRRTLAILESREFNNRFVKKRNLLPYLFYSEWDASLGKNVVDPSVYDEATGIWLDENAKERVSDWDVSTKFNSIRGAASPPSGLITISIRWTDPAQAADWVNWLVEDINTEIKQQDLNEANRAIEYLTSQLDKTQLVEMQSIFYDLIESQTRTLMLADVREEYIFHLIDPALKPERKVSPNRSIILFVGSAIGTLLALTMAVIRSMFFSRKRKAHT